MAIYFYVNGRHIRTDSIMKLHLCNATIPKEFLCTVKHVLGYRVENRYDEFVYSSCGNRPVYVLVNLSHEDISYLILRGNYINEVSPYLISDIILDRINEE